MERESTFANVIYYISTIQVDVFIAIVVGITASYVFEAREKGRLALVWRHPKKNWRMFIFDYLACGFIGTAVALYLFEAKTPKEGFLLGLTWEALAMAALNRRSKIQRGKVK